MKTPSNPYRDQPRDALHTAANKRAAELMKPTVARTPEQRAALALDTAHLLLALAPYVSNGEYVAGTPLNTLQGGQIGLRDVFVAKYAKLLRDARYVVFMEAADAALGGGVAMWKAAPETGGALYESAMKSDDGLMAALAQMQVLYEIRRNKVR
jgi:hypothetical protein